MYIAAKGVITSFCMVELGKMEVYFYKNYKNRILRNQLEYKKIFICNILNLQFQ